MAILGCQDDNGECDFYAVGLDGWLGSKILFWISHAARLTAQSNLKFQVSGFRLKVSESLLLLF